MKLYDLALVGDEVNGTLVVHRAFCPEARAAAERGEPVATLFGCEGLPPDEWERHSCLDDAQKVSRET